MAVDTQPQSQRKGYCYVNSITYLCLYIQYLERTIFSLLKFIAKYIPLRQLAHDDSASPDYQKLKTDRLPTILKFEKQDWRFLLEYYLWKCKKRIAPVSRRGGKVLPEGTVCPRCGAPRHYFSNPNTPRYIFVGGVFGFVKNGSLK
jgi:hypothetical protein